MSVSDNRRRPDCEQYGLRFLPDNVWRHAAISGKYRDPRFCYRRYPDSCFAETGKMTVLSARFNEGKNMKEKIAKTNAARMLDKSKIAYRLIPYEVDENDLSARHVAESVGENIEQVFKTLVLHGDKTGHLVCVVPGDHEVDLKKVARASGNKKCEMIAVKELLPLTGYIRGGCSPVGMKKHFPTFIHCTMEQFDKIYVSAGVRGLQIEIAPADLIREVRATLADLVAE